MVFPKPPPSPSKNLMAFKKKKKSWYLPAGFLRYKGTLVVIIILYIL